MDKVAMLRSFIEKSPQDPFPRYGLGMELRRLGQLREAVAAFASLAAAFPDYVPTYLMAGQTLRELGEIGDARTVFDAGIAAAERKGDAHAKKELEGARDDLDLLGDE